MILLADENCIRDIAAKITITDLSPGRSSAAVRNMKNPIRLWSGYKSCYLFSKTEAVFMLKLLTTPDWRKNVIADLFPDAEVLGGSPIEPDCKYMNTPVYLALDNDLLRCHLLRNYLNVCPAQSIYSGAPHIYCLESHTAIHAALFPEMRIIPVRMSRLERILDDGGGP